MLRWQVGKQWRDANGLYFNHHDSIATLRSSHEMGCGICGPLYKELIAGVKQQLKLEYECDNDKLPDQLNDDVVKTDLVAHSTALLGVVREIEDEDVFRLDFTVGWIWRRQSQVVMKRTFVLNQHGAKDFT